MVSFTTINALITTAALLIQPCPAPPVITFVAACGTLLAVPVAIGEGIAEDSSVIVDGLLPDCIFQIQEYNVGSDTEKLDAKDGKVVVLNETSIQLGGLPEKIVNKFVEEYLKNHISGSLEAHP